MNNLLVQLSHYPVEALPYEIGFLILAVSMFWYSRVLKIMIGILHERPVWVLPLVGAFCLVLSVAMHVFAYLVLLPKMDTLQTVVEINQMTQLLQQWRAWSLTGILLSGLCSLIGGGLYYRWTTR